MSYLRETPQEALPIRDTSSGRSGQQGDLPATGWPLILTRLSELGVKIAVDDFGTGYSSLAFIRRYPVDTLKIDRSFVSDITTDPAVADLAAAIIGIGHSLGLKVVAEGVETAEQLEFLRSHKCDLAQGFYLRIGHKLSPRTCSYDTLKKQDVRCR